MKVLRTYRFVDKDPVKDELQTILQDTGLYKRLKIVAELSGLAPATLYNLFHGSTKRPQNATVMAIVNCAGYERKFAKARELNVDAELEFARAWNKKNKVKQERKTIRKRKRG